MRKYILLYASIVFLLYITWNLFMMNQPPVGLIGDGTKLSLNSWITITSSIFVAVLGLIVSYQLFKKEKELKK